MAKTSTPRPMSARLTGSLFTLGLLTLGLLGSGVGCISPELLEHAERIELFESEAAPDGYLLVGQVYVTERFPNLRPDEQRVIDKLKLRAAKLGADAIGNIHIAKSNRVRYAGTPRHVELRGAADYYRKRPPR